MVGVGVAGCDGCGCDVCCTACFSEAEVAWGSASDWGNVTWTSAVDCNPTSYAATPGGPCDSLAPSSCDWCASIGAGPAVVSTVASIPSGQTLANIIASSFPSFLIGTCAPTWPEDVVLQCATRMAQEWCLQCEGTPSCCAPGAAYMNWLVTVGRDESDGKCYLYVVVQYFIGMQNSIVPTCNTQLAKQARIYYRSAELTDGDCCTTIEVTEYDACNTSAPCDSYPTTLDVTLTCA